jgi:DNA methylase
VSVRKKKERLWSKLVVDGIVIQRYKIGEKFAAFERLREGGFPHYNLTDEEKAKELRSLLRYGPAKIGGGVILQTMHAMGLAWSYFPHAWQVRCGDALAPMEIFRDDGKLLRALDKRARHGGISSFTDSEVRKGLKSFTGAQGVSNFRPSAAWALYERYCPKDAVVYDPSCGWAGRMLGSFACKKVARYIGCEPSTKTFAGLKRMEADLARMMPDRKLKVELHCLGSEVFRPKPGTVDVCFTSPPYFDVEKYSDEESQSYKQFPTLDKWLNGFMKDTLANCMSALKAGGTLALNVNDALAAPVSEIAASLGFEPVETLRYRLSRMLGTRHRGERSEPVLVCRKKGSRVPPPSAYCRRSHARGTFRGQEEPTMSGLLAKLKEERHKLDMTIEYLESHKGIGLLDEVTTVRVKAQGKAQPKRHGRVWTPAMRLAMSRRLKAVIAAKKKAAETRSKAAKARSAKKPATKASA